MWVATLSWHLVDGEGTRTNFSKLIADISKKGMALQLRFARGTSACVALIGVATLERNGLPCLGKVVDGVHDREILWLVTID